MLDRYTIRERDRVIERLQAARRVRMKRAIRRAIYGDPTLAAYARTLQALGCPEVRL